MYILTNQTKKINFIYIRIFEFYVAEKLTFLKSFKYLKVYE